MNIAAEKALAAKSNSGVIAGAIGTAIYVSLFATYVYRNWTKVVALDPNALGDMIAGASAPLAFLWLVLGYFQQQRELRLNTEALRLQATELVQQTDALQKQHAETEELVKVGQAQLRLSNIQYNQSMRIKLAPKPSTAYSSGETVLVFQNNGAPATDVHASILGVQTPVLCKPNAYLGRETQFRLIYESKIVADKTVKILVEYRDEVGNPRHCEIEATNANVRVLPNVVDGLI